jgi:hypothetical protein
LCNHIPEQVYQKYTPEKERPSIHGGILRYGGSKVHENICTNRPVPNGTLGGVRGSDDTYSIIVERNTKMVERNTESGAGEQKAKAM